MPYKVTVDDDYVLTIDEENNMVRTGIPAIINANDSIQRIELVLAIVGHLHQFNHWRFSVERIGEQKK